MASAGIDNSKWFKPVFLAFRSRLLSSEERSLLWQTMHSDGRFGYRVRAQMRPTTPGEADCPFCGSDRIHPATDPGETMEHAYGTCPGLDDLWVWAAETFLLPAGGAHAATRWTSAIPDPGRERRPLVNCVGPHILSGLLGVVRLNGAYRPAKLAQEEMERLHAWWSLIRATILVVLEGQRQNARRGVEKYKVVTVARPPLHVTKGCVLQRLRERVLEEVFSVVDMRTLSHGALLGNVLGSLQGEHITLSPLLGGDRVTGWTSKVQPKAPPQRRPQEDWRRSSPPPTEAKHAYLFFDGACKENPGPSAGGCVLKASNGEDILIQDAEYVGRKTNNEAEYCGLILGLHRAVAAGFTAISIRGDSQLVIDQITGRARCTTRGLSPLLDRALRLMKPRFFPHGIDSQWVRRNVNAEADAAANAGLRVRVEKRRILFYDD